MSSAIKPLFKVPGPLRPKTSLITNDYDLSQKVLGVGINGKVLECFEKKTGGKFALKVSRIIVRQCYLGHTCRDLKFFVNFANLWILKRFALVKWKYKSYITIDRWRRNDKLYLYFSLSLNSLNLLFPNCSSFLFFMSIFESMVSVYVVSSWKPFKLHKLLCTVRICLLLPDLNIL